MPNTGKSTFFNRLTGASARVGNWPGITVDLMGAKILLGGAMVELVDLPGIMTSTAFPMTNWWCGIFWKTTRSTWC